VWQTPLKEAKIMVQRAGRNRTITLDDNDISHFVGLCSNSYNENTIIHGDSFEILDKLQSNFVDLLIVDPPYNLSKTYSTNRFKKMDNDEYTSFTRAWLNAVRHTLKPNATIYVCSDWQTSLIVGHILNEFFTIQNRITWQREKGRGAMHNWKNSMEDIWFATVSSKEFTFNVDDVKTRRRVIAPYKINGVPKDWTESKNGNFRDTFPSNFWNDISIPYWSMPENTDHPTQKPEKLFAKLILASSNQNDMILDPFVGSGTSSVVAKKLGRRFLGIESEAEYCAYAQKRLEMADEATAIQGYVDGVFWERNTLALQHKTISKSNILGCETKQSPLEFI
jgi:site-specific DNA-methyltransferase (adenine-specific)